MEKRTPSSEYRAYLLRLRRNTTGRWHAQVTNPHTNEQWTFTSLRQFIAFLEDSTGEVIIDGLDVTDE